MTIEQRKKTLINWISLLEDEGVIDRLEGVQGKVSEEKLPSEILELLKESDKALDADCTVHSDVRSISK